MKRRFQILAAAVLVAFDKIRCFTQPSVLSPRNSKRVTLANIAEGQHLASQGISLEADVAITERNLLRKRGGAANRVTPCDAAGTPIGVCSDEAAAAGDVVNMRTLHSDLTIP